MVLTTLLTVAIALADAVSADRPKDTTICDYYTPLATDEENSAASQYKLMVAAVNTVVIGNYTKPNAGTQVAGIAASGKYQGHDVNLLPYFVGGYASTNAGGPHGVATNFLDDGDAVPLTMSKPANGTESKQFELLTHLYQYFGTFFGCSHQGESDEFPSYQGRASMYEVHKYMNIDKYEMGLFIKQVVDAVTSFGFEDADIKFTNDSLYAAFGHRCSPAAAVIPADAGKKLQSICMAPSCPLDANATCGAYPNGGPVEQPEVANATLVGDVMKVNETEAAPTAMWPAQCKDGKCGSATVSPSSSSSSSAGGVEGTPSESGNAATAVSFAQPSVIAALACLACTLVVSGTGAMTMFVM